MQQKELIKTLLRENGKTQTWLAQQLGYSHQSGISMILNRNSMEVDTLIRIAEVFDMELVICPKRRIHPYGEVVVTK